MASTMRRAALRWPRAATRLLFQLPPQRRQRRAPLFAAATPPPPRPTRPLSSSRVCSFSATAPTHHRILPTAPAVDLPPPVQHTLTTFYTRDETEAEHMLRLAIHRLLHPPPPSPPSLAPSAAPLPFSDDLPPPIPPDIHLCAGLDVEWRPATVRGAVQPPTSLVQLAFGDVVLLLHVCYFAALPPSLQQLLASPHVVMTGVGIVSDGQRIAGDFGVPCRGLVDTAQISAHLGLRRLGGLRTLSADICRLQIDKPKSVSRSNWERPLGPRQMLYAAQDAFLSWALLAGLHAGRRSNPLGLDLLAFCRRHGDIAEVEASGSRRTVPWKAAVPCGEAGGACPFLPSLRTTADLAWRRQSDCHSEPLLPSTHDAAGAVVQLRPLALQLDVQPSVSAESPTEHVPNHATQLHRAVVRDLASAEHAMRRRGRGRATSSSPSPSHSSYSSPSPTPTPTTSSSISSSAHQIETAELETSHPPGVVSRSCWLRCMRCHQLQHRARFSKSQRLRKNRNNRLCRACASVLSADSRREQFVCSQCGRTDLPREAFSKSQRANPVSTRRCRDCVGQSAVDVAEERAPASATPSSANLECGRCGATAPQATFAEAEIARLDAPSNKIRRPLCQACIAEFIMRT